MQEDINKLADIPAAVCCQRPGYIGRTYFSCCHNWKTPPSAAERLVKHLNTAAQDNMLSAFKNT